MLDMLHSYSHVGRETDSMAVSILTIKAVRLLISQLLRGNYRLTDLLYFSQL